MSAQHSDVHFSQGEWVQAIYQQVLVKNPKTLLCLISATQSHQDPNWPLDPDTSYSVFILERAKGNSLEELICFKTQQKKPIHLSSQPPSSARLSMGIHETLLYPLHRGKKCKVVFYHTFPLQILKFAQHSNHHSLSSSDQATDKNVWANSEAQSRVRGLNKAITFKMLQSQAEKPDLDHTHTVFNQEREIHHSVTYQTVFSFLFKRRMNS